MPDTYYIVPPALHEALVKKAYMARGYTEDKAAEIALHRFDPCGC